MSTQIINTCGLSCPQPVLLVHQAMAQGASILNVVVDNEASLENVTRAAQKKGYIVNRLNNKNSTWMLELRL